MNPGLAHLQPYPFERLRALMADVTPAAIPPIPLSLGEPRHPAPDFAVRALADEAAIRASLGTYPVTRGIDALREAIADWLTARYRLAAGSVDPARNVLPVNGTREALFAFAQVVVDPTRRDIVAMPNPFYQIYEGAALLAGAEPRFLPCTEDNGFRPDPSALDDSEWARCALLYVCSPGNPAGTVLSVADWTRLLDLSDRHGFVIAADECYSEIHPDEDAPPPGLLEACRATGRDGFENCIVFHSLSKRSSLPGLRSGFVAGDARWIERFLAYRTYHGCAMALQAQHVSTAAWRDEAHVRAGRAMYREKFERVHAVLAPVLDLSIPEGGFYFWPRVPGGDDEAFARLLVERANVAVLPGRYLGRSIAGANPGSGHVRMALVATLADCVAAAQRIRDVLVAG